MNILFVGSQQANTLEFFYKEGLESLNVGIDIFPARDRWRKKMNAGLINKFINRISPRALVKDINIELLNYLDNHPVNIVLVFKGMEISPSTLEKIKSRGTKLVMYNPDHPYIYSDRGSGNKWMKDAIPLYDLYLTYARDIDEQLKSNGINSMVIPFGFYLPKDWYEAIDQKKEELKICFLGNGDKYRTEVLNHLANQGLPVVVYGNNWKTGLNSKIEIRGNAYNLDFWQVMRRYRVQLNIMREHNRESHNMRTFDIPAVGGIQVAPNTPDHRKYFEPDKSIWLYSNLEECVRQCEMLLSLERPQANEIRTRSREHAIQSGYSYVGRSRELLTCLQQILN